MRRIYFLIIVLFASLACKAQVVLYSDTFSTDVSKWQFDEDNVFDLWDINNEYNCSDVTPDNGGGYYMHILDDLNGDNCAFANYLGSSGGMTIYATMKSGKSTIGQTLVTIKFDWLCNGQVSLFPSYGSVDYSPDGGTNWINITTPFSRYNGQSTWTTITISSGQVPGLLNHSDLRLRFGFTNSGYGTNPSFGIDNLTITGDVATAVTPALQAEANINVFLSPDQEELFVNTNSLTGMSVLSVYNLIGERIFYLPEKNEEPEKININGLPSGLYIVRVDNEKGSLMRKFVKNKTVSKN